jgi:hypothetical protein
MRREGGEALGVHLDRGADDLEHVAADEKLPPAPVTTTAFTSSSRAQAWKTVRQLAVALEGERVLLLRPVEASPVATGPPPQRKCLGRIREGQGDGLPAVTALSRGARATLGFGKSA